MKHRLLDIKGEGHLLFKSPNGEVSVTVDAIILALGGGSWSQLGSDGQWVSMLSAKGVEIAPLKPANCGFDVAWTDVIKDKFAGQPLKGVVLSFQDSQDQPHSKKGELMLTQTGLEGGLIYHFSAVLRDTLALHQSLTIFIDLMPDYALEQLVILLSQPKGAKTLTKQLRTQLGLSPQAIALLYECLPDNSIKTPVLLANTIKSLPIPLISTRPINEAISTAGGVVCSELTERLMLKKHEGIFCAGEMLDWEAPTGGYLLTAVMSTGVWVGHSVLDWLNGRDTNSTSIV